MKNKAKHSHSVAIISALLLAICVVGCGEGTKSPKKMQATTTYKSALTAADMPIEVAVGGNSWIADDIEASDTLISSTGLSQWQESSQQLVTYFYLGATGELNLGIKGNIVNDIATINVSINEQQQQITLDNTESRIVPIGTFSVTEKGYQKVTISGVDKQGQYFPDISALVIGGEATTGKNYYVKDDFYWGRRGPSVHLQYQLPQEKGNYEWFYSEITVPEGQDSLGSYYMANGFNGGYFGIQVNSETERRVLFSIWSPYKTDDPSSIPDEYKTTLLKKGKDVYTGKFGNEGSGGQSYVKYNWQTGVTYRFLTRYQPRVDENKTDFTAYFFDPVVNQWQLIASFRRPHTTTYLQSPYSFLENFIPGAGQFERMANYSNQWVKQSNKDWEPMLEAKFTYDATARKEARVDFQGGINQTGFYLKNTGFFSDNTKYNTQLTRTATSAPKIDLNALP
ncbi:DUF3472 domain-containing protein [Thalassotalea sediminis]|uniref:DUF3472 domain-containing protein n=1 Tax=Thalassotalea sediminis TaxID=1759089 RepID=UPI0025742113|nr:DUF3472 domain-containing protein [Thalassotalea sediminis]